MIAGVTRELVTRVATAATVPPVFACAIVQVESDGYPYAWNPEPRYRYLVNVRTGKPFRDLEPAEIASAVPPADFPCLAGDRDQEWLGQRASWGLMQVMGAVAREHGFTRPYLPELCDPETNVAIGCRVLRALLNWASGNLARAAAAYNAGRGGWASMAGQAYGHKVIVAMAAIELERRA